MRVALHHAPQDPSKLLGIWVAPYGSEGTPECFYPDSTPSSVLAEGASWMDHKVASDSWPRYFVYLSGRSPYSSWWSYLDVKDTDQLKALFQKLSTPPPAAVVRVNRIVSSDLLDALADGGALHDLVAWSAMDPLADIQLRQDRGNREYATLYYGLTSLLDVHHLAGTDMWHLDEPDETHAIAGRFDSRWLAPIPLDRLVAVWPQVMEYVARAAKEVGPPHKGPRREGSLHALISGASGHDYRIANREVSPAFGPDQHDAICWPIQTRLWDAIESWTRDEDGNWAQALLYRNLGTGLDFLGIDREGRVLAIEAKPADAGSGIVRGPVQTRFYAELLALWLNSDESALAQTITMLDQRARLGLSPAIPADLTLQREVVPVLAIGAGKVGVETKRRAMLIKTALAGAPAGDGVADLEIWRLDAGGRIEDRWP